MKVTRGIGIHSRGNAALATQLALMRFEHTYPGTRAIEEGKIARHAELMHSVLESKWFCERCATPVQQGAGMLRSGAYRVAFFVLTGCLPGAGGAQAQSQGAAHPTQSSVAEQRIVAVQ